MPNVDDDDEEDAGVDKAAIVEAIKSKVRKNPNNNFTRLLSSPMLFYIFLAVLLAIIVWWIVFMGQYANP